MLNTSNTFVSQVTVYHCDCWNVNGYCLSTFVILSNGTDGIYLDYDSSNEICECIRKQENHWIENIIFKNGIKLASYTPI
jgi:hypothetical protein